MRGETICYRKMESGRGGRDGKTKRPSSFERPSVRPSLARCVRFLEMSFLAPFQGFVSRVKFFSSAFHFRGQKFAPLPQESLNNIVSPLFRAEHARNRDSVRALIFAERCGTFVAPVRRQRACFSVKRKKNRGRARAKFSEVRPRIRIYISSR